MRWKTRIALTVCALICAGVAYSVYTRIVHFEERRQKVLEQTQVERPPAQERIEYVEPEPEEVPEITRADAINWNVPFTSQAPSANWDPPYDEACEEASMLMVLRYFRAEPITGPEDAEAGLAEIFARNESFGYPIDITAEESAVVLRSLAPELLVETVYEPTVEALKTALTEGALIIVPAQGQMLGNPYFRQPGPPYHMLVLRGFTDDGYVITNDPGTKRGEQYVYTWETLMDAMHDWNGGDVVNGQKVVIVVRG